MEGIIIEACVETIEEALYAESQGAHRLELCGRLDLDGLTPDVAIIQEVREKCSLRCKVMLRHRAGDFEYNDEDRSMLLFHHDRLLSLGVTDIVFGATKNGLLDLDLIHQLCSDPRMKSLTIHKAIDTLADPLKAIKQLKEELSQNALNLSFLSSGGQLTALEGIGMLNRMAIECGQNIELIAAGKITKQNLGQLSQLLTTRSFHGRRIV